MDDAKEHSIIIESHDHNENDSRGVCWPVEPLFWFCFWWFDFFLFLFCQNSTENNPQSAQVPLRKARSVTDTLFSLYFHHHSSDCIRKNKWTRRGLGTSFHSLYGRSYGVLLLNCYHSRVIHVKRESMRGGKWTTGRVCVFVQRNVVT